MTVYLEDTDFTLYVGDVRDVLAEIPAESVHCVVTSPPYWGLRDYGTGTWDGGNPDCDHKHSRATPDGLHEGTSGRVHGPHRGGDVHRCGKCGAHRVDRQLGLEATPAEYVQNMVDVFRQVRRVLRDDGTLWLNLGDSYASGPGGNIGATSTFASPKGSRQRSEAKLAVNGGGRAPVTAGLKPKDLVGIPWRVAFALQQDGWYLRSDIIWGKPNPMPESVTDRPTKAHEYLFLLTKSPRYYFDQEAVREPVDMEYLRARWGGNGNRAWPDDMGGKGTSVSGKTGKSAQVGVNPAGRNVRSVWEIATQPYPDAHFATFPEELPRRCISAGTSERGVCPVCGAPWERVVERERIVNPPATPHAYNVASSTVAGCRDQNFSSTGGGETKVTTTGWRPTCDHPEGAVPAVVLDPFAGSGTTNHVARKHGRRSIAIELNPAYAQLAAQRMSQLSLLT